jgi:hypothetical protein
VAIQTAWTRLSGAANHEPAMTGKGHNHRRGRVAPRTWPGAVESCLPRKRDQRENAAAFNGEGLRGFGHQYRRAPPLIRTHRLLPYLPKEGEAIRAIALRLGLGFFIGSIIVDCGRSEEEAHCAYVLI